MIPFIDEKRLLEARAPLEHKLTADEARRNTHGPMFVVEYSADDLGPYPAPAYFPTVERNHALARKVWRQEWDVPIPQLRKGLMDGVKLDVFFPGFPTLKHIRHTAKLQKGRVASRFSSVWSRRKDSRQAFPQGHHDSCVPLHQLAAWSSAMILAPGARGPGFNSRSSP